MKKELCLMSTLLVLCSSYNCVNADEKTAPPAAPAATPAAQAPASKPEAFINTTAAKPAAENASKDANADPLAFLPDLVAKIGDDKITKADIVGEFKPVISMMKESGQLNTIPAEMWKTEVKKRVNDMIAAKLLLKLAEADGYKPDAAKAEEEFKKLTAQVPPEQLAETLAKQGMTTEAIKGRIAIGLAIQKWIEDKVAANIKVSDEDAEKFYNENQERFKKPEAVRASHILIKADEIDPAKAKEMTDEQKKKASDELKQQALKKAEDILAKLKQGGDFAKLATENSACPSKEKGGDLGSFERGKMTPAFEKSAFSLKPGEMSDVVETEFGYHIIKTTEKNDAGITPFKDVKGFLVEGLKKQKTSQIIQEKIETEKKNKKVELFV
ncbi:MAG: peptidylprolyl isomerase [Victivallales bacterium]